MKFLDLNGLTSVLSKLLTKVSTAFDGLEERVTAAETAIEGKADAEHRHEDVNELIKELYVNAYDGSESQLNMLVALSGGLNETVNVGDDANVYICNNGDAYIAGSGATDDFAQNATPLKNLVIYNAYILNGVDKLGECLFATNTSLKNVYMADSIKNIGEKLFIACTNLIFVNLSNSVASIPNRCFSGCDSLIKIIIPGSVKKIEEAAFISCTGLQNVTISEGVEEIGSRAFQGCTELVDIFIPNSVTSISRMDDAFMLCTKIEIITIDKPQDSIAGQPWGAAGAEVIWLG